MNRPAPRKTHRRLCIVRTLSGRDYHFPLTGQDDPNGYRLQRHSDALHLVRNDGQEKMVFYKEAVECVRFEEGLDDGRLQPWVDPIL